MFWKILFSCHVDCAADLGSALEDYAIAVSWFETKEDPSLWVVEALTTIKPYQEDIKRILSPVCTGLNSQIPLLTIDRLPEADWLEAAWCSFPPRQMGRYYVYGSHTTPELPINSIPIEINAATAFGSGEHETTTGCLLTLDDLARQKWRFQTALDMGCGSGILGIAVAKTWGIPVTAVDNDPESVRVTRSNAYLNHCTELVKAYESDGFSNAEVGNQGPFDIIVANILASPLLSMAEPLSNSLKPQGFVILSGLLKWQANDIVQTYKAYEITLISQRTLNDWEALLLVKG